MSTWFYRLKEVREWNGLTQHDLGEKIGKDVTAVSRYENGKGARDLPYQLKKSLLEVFKDREVNYIETGVEPENENITKSSSAPNKFIHVPILSAKAGASRAGATHYEVYTQGELMIDRILFKIIPNLKNVRAIEVDGDSMRPTLNEGDFVIIEENGAFSGEGIYVLQYDGTLLVKRLQPDFDGIEILSDNPNYKTRKFNPSDDQSPFHIVGKVILKVQR